jgi:hypothetical protein
MTLVAGVSTVLSTVVVDDLIHTAGGLFTLRCQIGGTRFRAKVWQESLDEPGWQLSTTTSAITAAGKVAIRTLVSASATVPITYSVRSFKAVNGEVDDITDQAGAGTKVEHSLTSGLPTEVDSFAVGIGTANAAVPLAYGRLGQVASRYFSPFNQNSPIIDYPRDVPPATIDVGLVTDDGIERVRVFTGQLANTPVRGRAAEALMISATRMKMSKLVQPPGLDSTIYGLNATWVVSWALYQSGIYVSPPPLEGCRMWMPLHGSGMTFIPDMRDLVNRHTMPYVSDDGTEETDWLRHRWIHGPWLMAIYAEVNDDHTLRLASAQLETAEGTHLLTTVASVGRVEFWFRADGHNFNGSPPGSGGVSRIAGYHLTNGGVTEVRAGIDPVGNIRVLVHDGTNSRTLTHSTAMPSDGEWHFVGFAWSVSGNKLWVNLDGDVETSTPGLSTTNLSADEDEFLPTWVNYVPASDVYVTSGAQANPDSGGAWANESTWTQGATVYPSSLELIGLAEQEPVEVWELIGRYAEAELAVMRTDESDRFLYLPLGYWALDAQQATVDTLSTVRNVGDIDVSLDPIQVRNSVRVGYTSTIISGKQVYSDSPSEPTSIILPGDTILTFEFSEPVLINFDAVPTIGEADVDLIGDGQVRTTSYLTINTSSDGSGDYFDETMALIDVTSWHPGGATILIQNLTSQIGYLANHRDIATIFFYYDALVQSTAYVVKSSDGSQTQGDRGERGVAVDLSAIQRPQEATAIARHLAVALGYPLPRVPNLQVFGDPRRQPGDLVEVADSINTDASGDWRVTSVEHNVDGAKYTQKVSLARSYSPGRWGDGVTRWGRSSLWKRRE